MIGPIPGGARRHLGLAHRALGVPHGIVGALLQAAHRVCNAAYGNQGGRPVLALRGRAGDGAGEQRHHPVDRIGLVARADEPG
ncbi:hypothetical protein ACU4GR_13360 [Methylobacterium oryzae CBMB20]